MLSEFTALVGDSGPVCVAGGRTQWSVGGPPLPGTREVLAPAGVVAHKPAEMIVRVRAGTTVAALNQVLAEAGQMVPLDPVDPARATLGGVLAVGQSGGRRLRYGPARDTVLEVKFVSAAGELVKAGGPVVKNVTGFDLCRLMVGSLGTLGLMAEMVLRCSPIPSVSRWLASTDSGPVDPFALLAQLNRPSSILWDGARVWVLLEGHSSDVTAQAAVLGTGFVEVEGPPAVPAGGRVSLPAASLPRLVGVPGPWRAQVGVGLVEASEGSVAAVAEAAGVLWPPVLSPRVAELHQELKRRFDPEGRLNPGRQVGTSVSG